MKKRIKELKKESEKVKKKQKWESRQVEERERLLNFSSNIEDFFRPDPSQPLATHIYAGLSSGEYLKELGTS